MKITKINKSELGQMSNDYSNELTSPLDDMYEEGIILSCDFSQINNDYMFHEDEVVIKPMPFEGIIIERPNIDHLEEMLAYFESIGMTGDWLSYYMTQRINTHSIILYRYNNDIIGTGEIRPSNSSTDYANVGMTVSSDFRRRGLGSYILTSLRIQANEKGYKAICSTDNTNTASYNTIIKSGFVCYHKIEEISF